AYIVERDGTIYEVFPPECWAYHLKIGASNERRSIGIEVGSEGGLLYRGGKYYCFDRVSERTEFKGKVFDFGKLWRRQYRYFAAYTLAQVKSIKILVDYLLHTYNIPPVVPKNLYMYNPKLKLFAGILGHHHVRADKTDVHPGFKWQEFINELGLHRM
ncbi:MAG TPA: N-acetylmuramoyl-L-alanine amidase, partial [Methylophaga aminisulfidivorans]|nr:N-acetylmuramoyl-L-alanine amidase [Methylophaga aminisulfidivorans]